jgi:hypothetical protein
MKKFAMIMLALLAAPKLRAAKVCVSEAQFKAIYESVYPRSYKCSNSPTSHNDGTGSHCWCFASGVWSFSVHRSNCPADCPYYCGVF